MAGSKNTAKSKPAALAAMQTFPRPKTPAGNKAVKGIMQYGGKAKKGKMC